MTADPAPSFVVHGVASVQRWPLGDLLIDVSGGVGTVLEVSVKVFRRLHEHERCRQLVEQAVRLDAVGGADRNGPLCADHPSIRLRNPPTLAIDVGDDDRSEEHTSELQSLMRISYAVFCL